MTDPTAERKAREIWLAAEFAAMRAEVEELPSVQRCERFEPHDRLRSRGLSAYAGPIRIRTVTVTEQHAEYVAEGIADVEAWLDIQAVWGEQP